MFYMSTRGAKEKVPATAAVLRGIAPDGGLYMPDCALSGRFDWQSLLGLATMEISEKILGFLLPDFNDMHGIVHRAYEGKFESDELTPVKAVGGKYVLELFRGPTSAFKDVALSVLPQLVTAAKRQQGITDDIVILTATSGDTGKAALEGFHDVDGTKIIVFYPDGGVSAVQRAQMVTQVGNNVRVCAVRGNFDDAQTGVKEIFAAVSRESLLKGRGARLSSANSINIGRLAPQLVYYFKAYSELVKLGRICVGEKVDFTVPTGNFGDILAGYLAKCLGLPVDKLICASNANNVLTDFFKSGTYDRRRPFFKTASPSMDILVSSNLERLLFLLSDGDAALVSDYMERLKNDGCYTVSPQIKAKMDEVFCADFCDDTDTEKTIGALWRDHGYLCDTHTAVAWRAAEKYAQAHGSARPNVVLSTASPYKFPKTVLESLGETPSDNEFAVMEQLYQTTGVTIPKNLASLSSLCERHDDVVEKDGMLSFVLDAIGGGHE